jgi:NTE family protein
MAERKKRKAYRVGIALGSGSSRGWSHIGILRALAEQGIEPDIVSGCSIGALVGAAYASGKLDDLERWVSSLTMLEVARFLELNLSFNGFVDTERLELYLRKHVFEKDERIESLKKPFAAVATDLETGREVWFTRGPVLEAVRASIAMPGLFPPVHHESRWLVDGGLVNPVPVSLCRALGAEIVIAVNLNGDILGKHLNQKQQPIEDTGVVAQLKRTVKKYSSKFLRSDKADYSPPALLNSIAASINILQDRITRSRMAGDPPDLLLAPRLSRMGLLEFHRVGEAVQEGRECVQRASEELRRLFGGKVAL